MVRVQQGFQSYTTLASKLMEANGPNRAVTATWLTGTVFCLLSVFDAGAHFSRKRPRGTGDLPPGVHNGVPADLLALRSDEPPHNAHGEAN